MTSLLQARRWPDFVFAALMIFAGSMTWHLYGSYLDYYEQGILIGSAAGLIWLGWFWAPMRWYFPVSGLFALLAIELYQNDLTRGQSAFWLKYILASQSAVMWMCVLFFLAMLMYWVGIFKRSNTALKIATGLTWAAAYMAMISKLVRWYESYLIGTDVGHIPVSNLYEVFILFCLMTAVMYLYYEAKFNAKAMGAFVLPIICAAVAFIVWYSFDRQAHEIQPLIPALQSWWMKIHVPANFVGYGAFAISAMLGVAWLLATPAETPALTQKLLIISAAVIFIGTLIAQLNATSLASDPNNHTGVGFAAKFGYSFALLLLVAANRGVLQSYCPKPEILEEVSYQAIAIGFLFFTIATVLGAMWAADAWGGYWSWDPKETWALIVWLNYAAWLHIRLVKGWRGEVLAWWSVIGLFITSFAFIGVNMFLSGLHSYGGL